MAEKFSELVKDINPQLTPSKIKHTCKHSAKLIIIKFLKIKDKVKKKILKLAKDKKTHYIQANNKSTR